MPPTLPKARTSDGELAWLDALPELVGEAASRWSLTIGRSFDGFGMNALVVEATTADGTAAVLELAPPSEAEKLVFEATVLRLADAIACAERRAAAHDDAGSVLCHGDLHELNALQAEDGTFKLVDPEGVVAEPEYDLGVRSAMRRARTTSTSERTGWRPRPASIAPPSGSGAPPSGCCRGCGAASSTTSPTATSNSPTRSGSASESLRQGLARSALIVSVSLSRTRSARSRS